VGLAAGHLENEGRTLPRVDALLDRESIVWLSSVRPDGRPHLIPIWFWWDGQVVLFASKPQACKVANLRANADCMLAIGEPDDDFDVALIEARAELASMPTDELLAAGLLGKYRDRMHVAGLTPRNLRGDLQPGRPDRPDPVASLAR
jgi:PPOX class probable F420-dependent enzyme